MFFFYLATVFNYFLASWISDSWTFWKLDAFDISLIYVIYESRLKSSWTGGNAPLLCLPMHNSGALPLVHELFKRPSYISSLPTPPCFCFWFLVSWFCSQVVLIFSFVPRCVVCVRNVSQWLCVYRMTKSTLCTICRFRDNSHMTRSDRVSVCWCKFWRTFLKGAVSCTYGAKSSLS